MFDLNLPSTKKSKRLTFMILSQRVQTFFQHPPRSGTLFKTNTHWSKLLFISIAQQRYIDELKNIS